MYLFHHQFHTEYHICEDVCLWNSTNYFLNSENTNNFLWRNFFSIWRHKVLHVPSIKSAGPHIALKIIFVCFVLENISLSHNSLSCSIIFYKNFSNLLLDFVPLALWSIYVIITNVNKEKRENSLKQIISLKLKWQ